MISLHMQKRRKALQHAALRRFLNLLFFCVCFHRCLPSGVPGMQVLFLICELAVVEFLIEPLLCQQTFVGALLYYITVVHD